jgi:hypothetical protein
MQGSTIKDDLAIAGDGHSLPGVLSKPVGIDAHRAGNPLVASQTASQTIPTAVQINNHDLFARV